MLDDLRYRLRAIFRRREVEHELAEELRFHIEQYADVVQLFALYYVLLAFSTVAIAALSARRLTRDVFVGQAAGAALSLAVGWILLRELGPEGGVVGMLLSWVLAMVFFVRALRAAPDGRATPDPSPARASSLPEL